MANGGDLRFTAAGASSIERASQAVPLPPRETPTANIPPPRSTAPNRVNLTEENQSLLDSIRYYTTSTDQGRDTCLQSLFNLMTRSEEEGAAQFREVVSRLDEDRSHLRRMALLLTSRDDRFFEMARNKNGSNRIQELLGITDDVHVFFFTSIMRRFVHVMTDHEASRVGLRGMQVFSQERRENLYDLVLHHAVQLACERSGYAVLNKIIDGLVGHVFYRERLLDIVAQYAPGLSSHAHGNYVVQHVLTLRDLRCTHNVAVSLRGRFLGLSFTKTGSYVVQKLLDTEAAAVMVVGELQQCDGASLVMLARSHYGNYVVLKALRAMQEWNRVDLFWGLANKLMPYVHLFRGRSIGEFLYSLR